MADGYQEPRSIGESPDWAHATADFRNFKITPKGTSLRASPAPPLSFNILGLVFDWASAYNYALSWALSRNPAYTDYSYLGGDCANFVSQSFTAGGYPVDSTWYKYSGAWLNNYSLRSWLISSGRGISKSTAGELGYADIVNFDWNIPNGTFDHVAIVTGLPGPLVSCHSNNYRNVPYSWLAGSGTNCIYASTWIYY